MFHFAMYNLGHELAALKLSRRPETEDYPKIDAELGKFGIPPEGWFYISTPTLAEAMDIAADFCGTGQRPQSLNPNSVNAIQMLEL